MLLHQTRQEIAGAHILVLVGAGLEVTPETPNDGLMVGKKIGKHFLGPQIFCGIFPKAGVFQKLGKRSQGFSPERARSATSSTISSNSSYCDSKNL